MKYNQTNNYYPLDTQVRALKGKLKHHLTHEFLNEENKQRNFDEMKKEYEALLELPLNEITSFVWDSMNNYAEKVGIK